jgi:ketosteroid isomerase-like protein
MRYSVLLILVGICVTGPGSVKADDQKATTTEREIRELEGELSRAVLRGDRAFFERVLAEDFTHTSHSGQFKTRIEWMSENKFESHEGKPEPGKTHYDAFEVDDLAVRIYGETAVVTGRSTPRGRTAKGDPIRGRYRFLRVWVKRGGRWQVVAFEGTRIAEP